MREMLLLISIGTVLMGGFATGQTGVRATKFENQYLTMTILPGWTVTPSEDQKLNIVHEKYLLTIDPIFTHASGIICGRFEDVAHGPSVDAVMSNTDHPAGGFECSQWPPEAMIVTKTMSLSNLYTDSSKSEKWLYFPTQWPAGLVRLVFLRRWQRERVHHYAGL